MPICAAMSPTGYSVARRAISMAGGRGTRMDHARIGAARPRGGRAVRERSVAMSKSDGVFIYIGTYASEVDARADYDVVKELHAQGAVGTYDAAVITKDDNGKVHVNKDETTTRHGAWG